MSDVWGHCKTWRGMFSYVIYFQFTKHNRLFYLGSMLTSLGGSWINLATARFLRGLTEWHGSPPPLQPRWYLPLPVCVCARVCVELVTGRSAVPVPTGSLGTLAQWSPGTLSKEPCSSVLAPWPGCRFKRSPRLRNTPAIELTGASGLVEGVIFQFFLWHHRDAGRAAGERQVGYCMRSKRLVAAVIWLLFTTWAVCGRFICCDACVKWPPVIWERRDCGRNKVNWRLRLMYYCFWKLYA